MDGICSRDLSVSSPTTRQATRSVDNIHIRAVPASVRLLPKMYHGEMKDNFGMRMPLTIETTTMKTISGSSRIPASSGPSP